MSNMNHQEYDAIIIGGGITGAGVARDCSLGVSKSCSLKNKTLQTGPQGEIMVFCTAVHAMQ